MNKHKRIFGRYLIYVLTFVAVVCLLQCGVMLLCLPNTLLNILGVGVIVMTVYISAKLIEGELSGQYDYTDNNNIEKK